MKAIVYEKYGQPEVLQLREVETAAEAHRYVEEGHKKGSVVITLGHVYRTD